MLLGILALAATRAGSEPIVIGGMLAHPRRLLVRTSGPAPMAAVSSRVAVLWSYPQIGWQAVEVPAGKLQATRAALMRIAGVERVDFDRAARPAYDPNDPLWPNMWHFRTIKADLAWDLSFGTDTVVAVIDTGVNTSHPDMAANIWRNADEIPGNGVDDDSNGYVDDVVGYDFAYGDPVPDDVYGHGTGCAGLVGAVQDNTIGVTGVAPRAKIMCLKTAIDSGYLYDSANVPAYMYAAANGARVMSMSFYSDRVSQAERDAIDYCWSQGILPVAAAGNDSTVYPYYPAGYENTLAVAATNESNGKAGFSDYGSWVDVAAPGVSLTTVTAGGGYTNGFGGTSGATPHVAGLATLLFGAKPSATAAEVRAAIEDTATPLSEAPYGEFSNYGLINAQAAMSAILSSPAPARSNRVRYVTPISSSTGKSFVARVYGRGFQAPLPLRVKSGGAVAKIMQRGRDWADVLMPVSRGPIEVTCNGTVTTIQRPILSGLVFPFIEGSSPGASVFGGFREALLEDGVSLRCTRRSDGFISLQGTFRRVQPGASSANIVFTRRYTGGTSGTERVLLYDWSSGSYPYGSYVELYSGPMSGTYSTTVIPVPQPDRFIDFEGTSYLLIQTSGGLPSGAELELDRILLVQSR